MTRLTRIVLTTAMALLIMACGDSKMAKLSDTELNEKIERCRANTSPSPGFAVACDNYQRECDRRRKEGKMVCF